jgi:hypothetical protein
MEADGQSITQEAYRLQIRLTLLHLVYSYYNKIINLN